jgi:LacI family transcriptional regulator
MANTERIAIAIPADYGYLRSIIRGIHAYARPALEWIFCEGPHAAHAVPALKAWKPSGVVAHLSCPDLAEAILELGVPVVNTSHVLNDLRIPRVGVDDAAVGRVAAEFFVQRKFENFAFIGEAWNAYSRDRQAGYQQALREAGSDCAVFQRRQTSPPHGPAYAGPDYDEIGRWLASLPRPLALLAANDHVALRVGESRLLAGLRVPEDISLLGVDDDDLICNMAYPPLASIALPGQMVGYKSAELLRNLMAGMTPPEQPLILPPTGVVLRASANSIHRREQQLAR